jgi:hypothetical protein
MSSAPGRPSPSGSSPKARYVRCARSFATRCTGSAARRWSTPFAMRARNPSRSSWNMDRGSSASSSATTAREPIPTCCARASRTIGAFPACGRGRRRSARGCGCGAGAAPAPRSSSRSPAGSPSTALPGPAHGGGGRPCSRGARDAAAAAASRRATGEIECSKTPGSTSSWWTIIRSCARVSPPS